MIDFRIKYDYPVREIGRAAFDVPTIGAGSDWLAVAQAALSGDLTQRGTVAPSQFHGCARLALPHSLCTTFLAALAVSHCGCADDPHKVLGCRWQQRPEKALADFVTRTMHIGFTVFGPADDGGAAY